ncbi:hypothetical protein Droror1_Dr00002347 [Drosera rotundifolia]
MEAIFYSLSNYTDMCFPNRLYPKLFLNGMPNEKRYFIDGKWTVDFESVCRKVVYAYNHWVMTYIENETIQPEGSTESVGYTTRAQPAVQEGVHEVAAGEQPPKLSSSDLMIVMMEELLRIRKKAQELAELDTEKYF